MTILLRASGVDKTFDRTRALADASLEIRRGEIHALIGANGAGKSTLSKVIAGHFPPDKGELIFKDEPLTLRRPRDAFEAGIAIVMQETNLAPDLSVLENIFLPVYGERGFLSYSAMRHRATEVLTGLGQTGALRLDVEVRDLSAAQRQLVEIAKALVLKAELIIFDEPTSSLSPSEVERLFDLMHRLSDEGHSLVFVSHRLEEVFAITDRVTVMREGRTVASGVDTESLTQADIIRLMVGHDIGNVHERGEERSYVKRSVVLEASGLSAKPRVRNVSFQLHAGEILGLGGLVGAGRSETAEVLFGLRRRNGGKLYLAGKPFSPKKPVDAIRAGIGFVAEDRRTQSIVPDLSVKENLLLGHLGAHRGFGLAYGQHQAKIKELLVQLDLPSERLADASLLNFSGGMQQKIIIARWLLLNPRVLILDEPTKGVDIGTRQSIYAILREIANQGIGVLVISSDFQELIALCERIVVMSDGISIADVPSTMLDEEKLTLFAAPRSSMERTQRLLHNIAQSYDASAFWAILDKDMLFCLTAAVAENSADPGFVAGDSIEFGATRIEAALTHRDGGFVTDHSTELSALIVDIKGRRGHDLGTIGLVLPPKREIPDPAHIKSEIEALFKSDAISQ